MHISNLYRTFATNNRKPKEDKGKATFVTISLLRLFLSHRKKLIVRRLISLADFWTTKYFCKTNFNMGKIKKEEAAYADLPKIYAFKDERQKEIMLNRNFARVNREIDEMIKSLLNSV